jgi:hypothetical protein
MAEGRSEANRRAFGYAIVVTEMDQIPVFPGFYIVDASDTVPTGINDNGVITGDDV